MKDCCLIKQLNKCHFQVGATKAPFLAETWVTRKQDHCRTDSHSPWAWQLPTGCLELCQRHTCSPLPFCTWNSNSSNENLCLLGSVTDSWRGTAGLQPGSQLDIIRMRKKFPSQAFKIWDWSALAGKNSRFPFQEQMTITTCIWRKRKEPEFIPGSSRKY